MMKKYFIIKSGRKIGPLTVKEVFEQRPTLDTQVWCDGMDDWKRLENVEELAYGFPNRPTLHLYRIKKLRKAIIQSL